MAFPAPDAAPAGMAPHATRLSGRQIEPAGHGTPAGDRPWIRVARWIPHPTRPVRARRRTEAGAGRAPGIPMARPARYG